jgi:hypothetical protein
VTVTTANGTTPYRWQLKKQSSGEHEGCWMTAGVQELEKRDGYGVLDPRATEAESEQR